MNPKKVSTTPPQKRCKVCEEAESKYKCPTCLIPYCSLVCFKKHKESPCVKSVPASENDTSKTIPPIDVNRPCYVDVADDVLSRSHLERIASSTEIRNALKDKELQKLIHNIDCSEQAEAELDKAMDQEAFRLFSEKILSVVNQSSSGNV